jgi:hypothetical protein
MNRCPVEHSSAERCVSPNGVGITDSLGLRHSSVLRDETVLVTIDNVNERVAGFAESGGCPSDSAEHRLNVVRRT